MPAVFTITQVVYGFTATVSAQTGFTVTSYDSTVTITEQISAVTVTNTTSNFTIVQDGIVSFYGPSTATVEVFTGTGVQTLFTLTNPPISLFQKETRGIT